MTFSSTEVEALCKRLNQLSIDHDFAEMSCAAIVEMWFAGWFLVAARGNVSATDTYVLTRNGTYVWLSVSNTGQTLSRAGRWADLDRHARAAALFSAVEFVEDYDYTGLYLAVSAWARQAPGTGIYRNADEATRMAPLDQSFFEQVREANPGVDAAALDMLDALGH